jgi:quercetin dioxygenase-like cupin family protein
MIANAKHLLIATIAAAFMLTGPAANAQDLEPKNRVELKRGPLTGTNMEVIISTAEYKPGEIVPRHIHHGEEAVYVLQGATVETPDGKRITMTTGAGSINVRDIPHAGFKVVGDTALKLVTVHIVDKGAPLYDTPGK